MTSPGAKLSKVMNRSQMMNVTYNWETPEVGIPCMTLDMVMTFDGDDRKIDVD